MFSLTRKLFVSSVVIAGLYGLSSAQALPESRILEEGGQEEGITAEAADAMLPSGQAWSLEFSEFLTWVQSSYPNEVAFSEVDEGNFTASVGFKGSIPEKVKQRMDSLSHPVYSTTDLGYSQEEVAREVETAYYEIRKNAGSAVSATAATVDFKNRSVDFMVNPANETNSKMLDSMIANTLQEGKPSRATDGNFSYSYHIDKNLVNQQEDVYGGKGIYIPGRQYPGCTTGFSARGHGVTDAVITAAHCVETGAKYLKSYPLTPLGTHPSRDVGWYSANQTTVNKFYDGSIPKTTSNVVNPAVGATYCFTGAKSGKKCDAVLALEQCSGVYCGLTMTHNHYSQGGDSGALWYSGAHPVGIHQGAIPLYGYYRSLFTPASTAEVVLGITIK